MSHHNDTHRSVQAVQRNGARSAAACGRAGRRAGGRRLDVVCGEWEAPGADAGSIGIMVDGRQVCIGATMCHASVAGSVAVRLSLPVLAELAADVGDPLVLNLGTVGRALAQADPGACWPAAVLGLPSQVQTQRRLIAGDAFFVGPLQTALQPGERVLAVHFGRVPLAAFTRAAPADAGRRRVGVFVSRGTGGVRVAVADSAAGVFRVPDLEAALDACFSPQAALEAGDSSAGALAVDGPAASGETGLRLSGLVRQLAARAVTLALAR